jgi:hypothetical protein
MKKYGDGGMAFAPKMLIPARTCSFYLRPFLVGAANQT